MNMILTDEIKEKLKDHEQYIPQKTPYCYIGIGWENNLYHIKLCPFWAIDDTKPYQLNGYCHYLKAGDWMEFENGGTMLLWDQCKECGINDELSSEDME